MQSKQQNTIKLLFLDPSRIVESHNELEKLEELGIIIIFEESAHPAYIVDTKILCQLNSK